MVCPGVGVGSARLERIRSQTEFHDLLAPLDRQGLLGQTPEGVLLQEGAMEIDKIAAELSEFAYASDITTLRHVRSNVEKRAA